MSYKNNFSPDPCENSHSSQYTNRSSFSSGNVKNDSSTGNTSCTFVSNRFKGEELPWAKVDSMNDHVSSTNIKVCSETEQLSSNGISKIRSKFRKSSLYTTFKVLSLLFLMMLIPPIAALFSNLSCMNTSKYCLPQFEVYTESFNSNAVRAMPLFQSLHDLIQLLSVHLNRPYKSEIISESISELLKNGSIYKVNSFGYCRSSQNDISLQKSMYAECHSLFDATDLFGVAVKDISFKVEDALTNGSNAEANSNVIVKLFRMRIHKFHSYSKSLQLGSLGATLSYQFLVLKIIGFGFNIISLILILIGIIRVRKSTRTGKLPKIKNVLIAVVFTVLTSSTIEIANLFFQRVYFDRLSHVSLREGYKLIHHLNYLTSGTVLSIISATFQVLTATGTFVFIIMKPWITKLII